MMARLIVGVVAFAAFAHGLDFSCRCEEKVSDDKDGRMVRITAISKDESLFTVCRRLCTLVKSIDNGRSANSLFRSKREAEIEPSAEVASPETIPTGAAGDGAVASGIEPATAEGAAILETPETVQPLAPNPAALFPSSAGSAASTGGLTPEQFAAFNTQLQKQFGGGTPATGLAAAQSLFGQAATSGAAGAGLAAPPTTGGAAAGGSSDFYYQCIEKCGKACQWQCSKLANKIKSGGFPGIPSQAAQAASFNQRASQFAQSGPSAGSAWAGLNKGGASQLAGAAAGGLQSGAGLSTNWQQGAAGLPSNWQKGASSLPTNWQAGAAAAGSNWQSGASSLPKNWQQGASALTQSWQQGASSLPKNWQQGLSAGWNAGSAGSGLQGSSASWPSSSSLAGSSTGGLTAAQLAAFRSKWNPSNLGGSNTALPANFGSLGNSAASLLGNSGAGLGFGNAGASLLGNSGAGLGLGASWPQNQGFGSSLGANPSLLSGAGATAASNFGGWGGLGGSPLGGSAALNQFPGGYGGLASSLGGYGGLQGYGAGALGGGFQGAGGYLGGSSPFLGGAGGFAGGSPYGMSGSPFGGLYGGYGGQGGFGGWYKKKK